MRFSANPALMIAVFCAPVIVTGCSDPPDAARRVAPLTTVASSCDAAGSFSVTTFGSIEASIEWHGEQMTCEGMKRPADRGARLRFSGRLDSGGEPRNLAFIISLPELAEGQTGDELSTRITVIEEDAGRFFSTQETDICWSNIDRHQPQLDSDDDVLARRYTIGGLVYCVAPIADLNGPGSLTISELRFSGRVAWSGT